MIQDAIDKDVPVPTLTAALFTRFRSRQEESFAEKMLAALRNAFGGHSVRRRGLNPTCLLYTSDAADDLLCVDLRCRRIINNKIISPH